MFAEHNANVSAQAAGFATSFELLMIIIMSAWVIKSCELDSLYGFAGSQSLVVCFQLNATCNRSSNRASASI